MDIPRKEAARRKRIRRIIYVTVFLAVIAAVSIGVSRLEPAAPTVDRATVWIDSVKRGEFVRQVRGPGTLVPEVIWWIPAPSNGRVEKIPIKPGARVTPNSILMQLSNPQLQQQELDAEWQLKAAQAQYANLKVKLQSDTLNQEASTANIQAQFQQAKLQSDLNKALAKEGLISDLQKTLSQVTADELEKRNKIEHRRLKISSEASQAQLAAQEARISQLQAVLDLRKKQVDDLTVRAGTAGVLQEVPVEVGQQVAPGTILARVAQPERLKAQVQIDQNQARDVQIGQKASIDTRNAIIAGRVARIDPSVRNGTVTVDVALEGDLPKGAVPDLSVDGTIEIERVENVLYVGRPVHGQSNSLVGLFKLQPDGEHAVRTQVKLGRTSVNTVEIQSGLKQGDKVILSDTSAWDSTDRILLK